MRGCGFALIWALLGMSVALAGCTRGTGKTSTLSFRIQNRTAVAPSPSPTKVSNVILNVSAPDMNPPLFYQCDDHSGPAKACPIAADGSINIQLQVSRGTGRLVQALVVYEDPNISGINNFRYGDAIADTSSDSATADIALTDAGASNIQGNVYGRYLDGSATGGPSGFLEARFAPPNGAREMTVIQSYMIAGWFQLFLLDGANLSYYLNGQPLYSKVNLSSPEFAATDSKTVRINVPQYDRTNTGPNGTAQTEVDGQQKIIVGFFGPAASSQVACYDNRSAVPISNAFQTGTSTALNYNGVSGSASDVTHEAGGTGFNMGTPSGVCATAATNFIDHMIFDETQLRNGKDSVAGFRGPFRMIDPSMSSYTTSTYDSVAHTLAINWSLLPDTPKLITGLRVFSRSTVGLAGTDDIYNDSGVNCPLVAADANFKPIADLAITTAQLSGTITASNVQGIANTQFVVCPYASGPTFLPAGVEANPGMMGPLQLDMRLVGSDTSHSMIGGPGLGTASYSLLKQSFINNFHNFIIQVGGRQLNITELANVQYSIDGGTTWQNLTMQSAAFNGGPTIAIVPVSSTNATFMTAVSAPTSDTIFKLKAQVTTAAQTTYGLTNDTYTSGPITLVGSSTCTTPGPLQAYDPVHGSIVASDADLFNASTGISTTDSDLKLKFRWSGCPTVYAPIDYYTLSAGSVPTNCFSGADFALDPSDPFAIHFAPADLIGGDCSVSSGSLSFKAPSNAGSDAVTFTLSSHTISHSKVTNSTAAVLTASALSSLGTFNNYLDFAVLGMAKPLAFQQVYLNSDHQPTYTTGVEISSTPFNTSGTWATYFNSVTGSYFSFTSTSPATSTPSVLPIPLAQNGVLPFYKDGTSATVLSVSSNALIGGSPLMLTQTGNTLNIAYFGALNGFAGQIKQLIPVNFAAAPPISMAKAILFNQGTESWVFVAESDTTGTNMSVGRITMTGTTIVINWATATNLPATTAYDATVYMNGTLNAPMLLTASTLTQVMYGSFPTWTAGTWSGQSYLTGGQTNAASTMTTGFNFTQCDNEVFATGSDGTYFMAVPISGSTPGTVFTPSGRSAAGYNRVTCLGFRPNGSSTPVHVFAMYNTLNAAVQPTIIPYEASTPMCGAAPNDLLSPSPTTFPFSTVVSGGYHIVPVNSAANGQGFAYVGNLATADTILFAPITSCSGGSLNWGASVTWGSLPDDQTTLNGLTKVNLNPSQTDQSAMSIAIFGQNSRYYQFHFH